MSRLKQEDRVICIGFSNHKCFVDNSFDGATGTVDIIFPNYECILVIFDEPITISTKQDTQLTFRQYSFEPTQLLKIDDGLDLRVLQEPVEDFDGELIEIDCLSLCNKGRASVISLLKC